MARFQSGTRGLKTGPPLRILVVALLVILPLLFRGSSCGHDFDFHLLSWMEAARAWHSGIWYPHWVQDANFGAGEPRPVFYPPLSWMLGGLLGGATSWSAAPILFVLVALLSGGWSMYLLAREWLSAETSSLAACLYVANPYALFVIYERSAFGELLAAAWMPLVVLFALRRSSSIVPLGIAIAAVWLTNAPAAVIASYTLAVLALVTALMERKAWPVWRAAGGTGLGVALAAFYVLPAVYEQRWVEVSRAILPGIRIQDSFLLEHTGSSLHDQVLRSASWILLLETAIAGMAAWLAWRKPSGKRAAVALASLLPLVLFLQLPVSAGVWAHLPEMKYLQFPWRWLLTLSVAACALIGMALEPSEGVRENGSLPRGRKKAMILSALSLAIVATIFLCSHLFFQVCDDQDAVAGQLAAFRMGPSEGGVEGTDEYTPAGADNSEVEQGLPLVRVLTESNAGIPAQPENPHWQPETESAVAAEVKTIDNKPERWTILLRSRAPGYAVLRLMDYPAWRVTLDGTTVHNRPQREDGLMAIPLPEGVHRIDVRWAATGDVIAGRAISVIALLFVILPAMESLHRHSGGGGARG